MFGLVRSTSRQIQAMAFLAAGLIPYTLASLPARAEQPAVETISLVMDQAKLVKLPGGADTIVIGNPAIADVTVQKNGVLVLTGRAAGRTNFIALNSSGNIISESMVTVTVPTAGRVLVQRGLEPSSYDCAPLCLPTVALGDEEKHFNRSVDQAQRRDGMANQSATAPGAKK
ncbi:MAG: pilus assembly protein N-terminal domain-containing protein [Beijerinckiaceae bacterium]|nr:pilus assembly protein N-terminal domain-containing protein [Beijerinckiaceae bacterium]MCZ8300811.1 pilus assembly protein N-terminal domain-containing protein [Beijerinckiaceae bacterium]